MLEWNQGKSEYSEEEAARTLGVSIWQLRDLVRAHITSRDEDLANVPLVTYRRADLLLLWMLSTQTATEAVPG
jgi:hypothetical protein